MKKIASILLVTIIIVLVFSTTAFAHGEGPTFDYALSNCVQGDLYSTFTLGEFSRWTWASYVEITDGTGEIDYSINKYSRRSGGAREVIYENEFGFSNVFVAWNVFIFPLWDNEILANCDWFIDHYNLIIPNMILFQNPEDPTQLLPIMTFGGTSVSAEQQEIYNGFVGDAICQAPVFEWIEEFGTLDMEGYWPCDEMMESLGGERYPLRCEAEVGEDCDSLVGGHNITLSWFETP